ncbi:MAG: hypothetical protein K1060chlam4_00549 [Candidatus Anoxychlamydiales bacterium]|nr:hypothetical protein [Candidatus Anoxychlamydiales bacterium]
MQKGSVVKLNIMPSKTIEIVKNELSKRGETSPDWWVLKHNGHKLENNKSLADYNIQKESPLEQIKPMQIFLKTLFFY